MKTQIKDCFAAEREIHNDLTGLDHEEVWVLFLRCDNTMIAKEMLTKGTLTSSLLDNRTVIRRALLNNAYGIILIHNHSSGNPYPSQEDIRLTANLKKACSLMDIQLHDHIIIGDDSWFSFGMDQSFNR